jgi:hypothetical protein
MEYGVLLLPAFTRLLSIPNMHIYMQSYFSKFQYNIIINLSIHNFLKTISHFFWGGHGSIATHTITTSVTIRGIPFSL